VLPALLAVLCAGCTSGRPTPPTTPPTSAALPPVASLPPTQAGSPGNDVENPPARTPAGQPGTVAADFAVAWARPDLPAERWWTGVAPFCEAGFAQRLRSVDPGNLPATRVTGPPVPASPPSGGVAVFTVPTDGGTLVVTVAAVGGRWLVTDDDFRRAVG
jgi:hypothetical protein